MIEILTEFYTAHYNFGIFAIFMLLIAIFLGSKKNVKGVLILISLFLVYNLVLYNKAKRDPTWYDKTEKEIKGFDPVKKLWEDKPADDDVNKRK